MALRVVGSFLVLAGIGHVWLPRALNWSTVTTALSPLPALVVTMHVGFVGLFLTAFGLTTFAAAEELTARQGWWTDAFLASGVIIFAVRWGCEIFAVSSALRRDPSVPTWWRTLHAIALIMWPTITAIFLLAWIL